MKKSKNRVEQLFTKVYTYMFIALIVTAISSFITLGTGLINLILQNSIILYAIFGVQITIVIYINGILGKVTVLRAKALLFIYSVLIGITLSLIFIIYTQTSIVYVFLTTAIMFGLTSVYGYITKKDLSKIGEIGFMGVIGLIISSIANVFLKSGTLEFIISIFVVIIFTGLTAYYNNKLKQYAKAGYVDDVTAVRGALALYISFINIFLALLRLFGRQN